MKTILVTGGAGFIGSSLIGSLINTNKIICLDNFDNFYSQEIKANNISNFAHRTNFKLFKIDIRNSSELRSVFTNNHIDTVIHLAAKAGVRPSIQDPDSYIQTNIVGTLNLLRCVQEKNIKKFIFASSSSIYGNDNNAPFMESMTPAPISPYAASKVAGEQLCRVYSYLYGLQAICLRFFTVYGPRQRPDLAIHKFTKYISENTPVPFYGDGNTQRDYTYIDDIVDGIIAAIKYKRTKFEIFNLGESHTISLKNLIILLEKELKKKAIIKKMDNQAGDVNITYANIDKARKILGYSPKTQIDTGIKKFVRWYQKK